MADETKTNGQQQPNTQPEDNGGSGKTFTQDEVNRIVSDRLARERTKAEPTPEEAKAQELTARENKLTCREYLTEKGYRAELLDILDASDAEHFKQAVDKLVALCPELDTARAGNVPRVVSRTSGGGMDDRIASAFKPKF